MTYKQPKLWVLGNGQLGAMMSHAAQPLAVEVETVDIVNPDDRVLPIEPNDIITAEREQWPESELSLQLSEHKNFINGNVFSILADRYTQKSLLDKLSVPTSPWFLVDDELSETKLHSTLGKRVLLKRRTGGYDGRGQHWLKQQEKTTIPADWRNEAIAEKGINFDEEVSLVGARKKDGTCVFYPLTLNLHQNGILIVSIANLDRLSHLQSQAEKMLSSIMNDLDYIGVMAMECFRVGDDLLVNELAPRVHNSGHWTQAGCHISQFELHVRTLYDLPIPSLNSAFPSAMVNLIGTEYDSNWLTLPNSELYWYNKNVRPGRKLGHLNLSTSSHEVLKANIQNLIDWLPEHYSEPLNWLKEELKI
ncbi:5-(carboxyamino)imidazole ribonucleotide synthase [Shewanella sp. 202IG2-18]|nr:5-(carboxyamino)imidazole ribonucleotide synthase [Parashewanella hymeniacidonis]MBM7071573.1 5-(carboxyamino)imidazole ribonucleotide synthase [Parashewanella hymeniacidonis]